MSKIYKDCMYQATDYQYGSNYCLIDILWNKVKEIQDIWENKFSHQMEWLLELKQSKTPQGLLRNLWFSGIVQEGQTILIVSVKIPILF